MMKEIIDYNRDALVAIPKSDVYVVTNQGQSKMRKTTIGWKLIVKWADDSESLIALKDMKESHPVELAEFSKSCDIYDNPDFAWWVPYTLRKQDIILSKIKARIRKTTQNYGIEMPTNIDHADRLDRENNNILCRNALEKEMTKIGISFEVLVEVHPAPPAWSKVTWHLVWDLKMDFTRKTRWLLDGHKTPNTIGSTYAYFVSRDSM